MDRAGASRALEPIRKRGWELMLDLSVALLWASFAAGFLNQVLRGGDLLDVGLFVFCFLIACSFVRRRPARRNGAWWENLLAWGGTILPMVGLQRASVGSAGWALPGLGVQAIALIGMIAALLSLGRSFGIGPADRGLVRGGLYRCVRHPLYATELLFNVGYLLGNPTWRNLAVVGLMVGIQVVRLLREERIISDYVSYASAVRWRLVPLVW